MAIEIINPPRGGLRTALETVWMAFGDLPGDDDVESEEKLMPVDRILIADDYDGAVGIAAAYPFALTIPGGELPAGGVTWVGVLPSHRRRGVLTALMRRQLDDLHARGEPLAILWASEPAIYGRFGYGIAAPSWVLEAEKNRFGFRNDPGPNGTVRLVDPDEAARVFPPVYESMRRAIPGTLARTKIWWAEHRLDDLESSRRGAGPKFYAALELDGGVAAYAIYRIKSNWEDGIPRSELRIVEAFAVSPAATRELWRFLFGIDLVTKVVMFSFDPASPLFLTVADVRSLHLQVTDGLWLRLVDVEAALRGRSYADAEPVVLAVRDAFCPWNEGRFRVGSGEVESTTAAADVEIDAAGLASAYLGAFDFHRLATADLARERRKGGLERASVLFHTARAPFCPEVF
jgi:predicted acetyltransferase